MARRFWLAATALALLAGLVGVYLWNDLRQRSGPAGLAGDASGACSTGDIRHLAVDRASAFREFSKRPAYTQGLVFADGELYESTGQEGESAIFRLDPEGGPATELARIDDDSLFGEGLAKAGDRFFQLTWQGGVVFAYEQDPENLSLNRISTIRREGEGWGLTTFEDELVLSDGSNKLSFIDPETFTVDRTVTVRLGAKGMRSLNELEFADGEVLANIYGDSRIIGIDPATGCVRTIVDASRLLLDVDADLKGVTTPICDRPCSSWDYVLNGIAFDPQTKDLYITGKNWPMIFVYRNLLD